MKSYLSLSAANLFLLFTLTACDSDAAKVDMARDHVRKLNKAADFYFVEHKSCPASANDLARLFTGQDDNDVDFSKDPWGNAFVMYPVAEGKTCHFKSLGSDGKEGGTGHAADIILDAGVAG